MGIRRSTGGAKVPLLADAGPPLSVLLSRLISLCAGLQSYQRHCALCRSAASESADSTGAETRATSACRVSRDENGKA
jgi:hypothetical protein